MLSYDEFKRKEPRERLALSLQALIQKRSETRIEQLYPDEGDLRRELYKKHNEFFNAGATHRVRSMVAANRIGKTWGVGGYETVAHLTGLYPPWWTGRKFKIPINAWAAGDHYQTVRDILQEALLGPVGQFGTGLIPRHLILGKATKAGIPNAVESIWVQHKEGRSSFLGFKSYDQGRISFQGTSKHLIWLDEEPPLDIYSECLYRTATTNGIVILTFTPLMGMTPMLKHLRDSKVWQINATWDDVPHLDEKAKRELIDGTPLHLRDARTKGIPTLGSGAVFPVSEQEIICDPVPIPEHWPRICGIDFGWDHPFAAVWIAWDRDADKIYVYDEYRRREATPKDHAADMRDKPGLEWIPITWPHDGLQHDKGSGVVLADNYRALGLPLLPNKFSNPTIDFNDDEDGGYGVEAGVMSMLMRMQSGRFKVFSTCQFWLEEFRGYHREDGRLCKQDDDLMSATRYAAMSLRFAETKPQPVRFRPHAVGMRNW